MLRSVSACVDGVPPFGLDVLTKLVTKIETGA